MHKRARELELCVSREFPIDPAWCVLYNYSRIIHRRTNRTHDHVARRDRAPPFIDRTGAFSDSQIGGEPGGTCPSYDRSVRHTQPQRRAACCPRDSWRKPGADDTPMTTAYGGPMTFYAALRDPTGADPKAEAWSAVKAKWPILSDVDEELLSATLRAIPCQRLSRALCNEEEECRSVRIRG